MLITRYDALAKQNVTMDILITEDQYDDYLGSEELIQNIFPELSKEHREFLITGYGPESQKILFGSPFED